MKTLLKWNDQFNKIIEIMAVLFFIILIISCVLQVFSRFVLNSAYSWTEELARYSFIWLNLLGAAICVKHDSHAKVTALYDRFSGNIKKTIDIVIHVIILLIAVVMIVYGLNLTLFTIGQSSPALKMSMALINASVVISGLAILFNCIVIVLMRIQNIEEEVSTK